MATNRLFLAGEDPGGRDRQSKAGAESDWWGQEETGAAIAGKRETHETQPEPTRSLEFPYRSSGFQGPTGRPGLKFMAQRGLVVVRSVAEMQHRA